MRLIRANEWWEYKIPPVLAAFYGTHLLARHPLAEAWPSLALLIVAVVAQASYVSLLNDLTDRRDDRAAGKPIREGGLPLLVASVVVGAAVIAAWRQSAWLAASYAAGWLAFSAYSLPPLRLKTRGLAGALCDAGGAHLFPTLTAVLLAARDPDRVWIVACCAWSFGNGIRGIVWHQLRDVAADVRAGAGTLVVRGGAARARSLATAAFAVEVIGLAVMLWRLRSVWPVAALALYALLVSLRPWRYAARPAIVTSGPGRFLVLHEYNEIYLPVSILIASGEPALVVLHLAFFPKHTLQLLREVAGLARLRRGRT